MDIMKILCIMHADFETPGAITTWAQENNHDFMISKPYAGDDCLTETDFDCLIIMGGPQSASDADQSNYLADEVHLIQRAIADNKIVIGFCLGAQLIGEALGAKAEKSPEKEVGVYPIFLTEDAFSDHLLQGIPETLSAIHWHNDMPGLTEKAQILAYSAGCPRQIIRYAAKVYGFQCHMEITKQGIETLIAACPDDLKPTIFTQSSSEILMQNYDAINKTMFCILNQLNSI
jgi:GMP synthase (glutamine-hydrolysing)